MMTMSCKKPFFVTEWFEFMDSYKEYFNEDQWKLRKLVNKSFQIDDIYVDEIQAEKYFSLARYLDFKPFPWQKFILGLHLCTYWTETNLPRWPDLVCLMGRGNGKDGTISLETMDLISPYNLIREYDVDICANNKDQAMRPVKDLITAFENNKSKLKKFFYWTQGSIKGKARNSYVKGHTNNAKGKDGLRSGCVIFNEYHAYENYANINVFTTGLGKKPCPRRSIYTTNGNVVEGPLDEKIKECEEILDGAPDNGTLPFLCRIKNKDDVHDETYWYQANPSLMYFPNLLNEIRKEYREWKENPARLPDFLTKRMNYRDTQNELAVTSWENIERTKQIYEEQINGRECICGIDFSKTTDWASVNLHFKDDEKRIDINHAWICMQNPEISRLKCPYMDWAEKGFLSLEYGVEIVPEKITGYIYEMTKQYKIIAVYIDSYRYALLRDSLAKIGYSTDRKNVFLVRPSDIMKTYPIIDRCFANGYFYWGEQPHLRWSTNNAKLIRAKKSKLADNEVDIGNYLIGKIEPKTRKTDPFMALVHSMVGEDKLKRSYRSVSNSYRPRVKVY